MVLVEAKDEAIPDPLIFGFVTPLPFGLDALNRVDAEIRSVFPREQLLVTAMPAGVLQRGIVTARVFPARG